LCAGPELSNELIDTAIDRAAIRVGITLLTLTIIQIPLANQWWLAEQKPGFALA
jgi:hypothetical protein